MKRNTKLIIAAVVIIALGIVINIYYGWNSPKEVAIIYLVGYFLGFFVGRIR